MGLLDRFRHSQPVEPDQPTPPMEETSDSPERPDPQGRNTYVLVILDSCRFDSFLQADTRTFLKLGELD